MSSVPKPTGLGEQLEQERRQVNFDVYDMNVQQLIQLVDQAAIDIAPEYQRQFVWKDDNQSRYIESIFLGIPVPSVYMATNSDSSWEVIDGVQRISTLIRFRGSDALRARHEFTPLKLEGLEKLESFNGFSFDSLPPTIQLAFNLKPIKVTTLNDKSDKLVRFDLFERLNTGAVRLSPQEIRNCIFRGPYRKFLKDCADYPAFKQLVKLQPVDEKNGTAEELVLRFFAYLHGYQRFQHDVTNFLNSYMKDRIESSGEGEDGQLFREVCETLVQYIPDGIYRGNRKVTPFNLYEAIMVGTALALRESHDLQYERFPELLDDEKLRSFTSGGTNNRRLVIARLHYVRDCLTA